ncbi:orotidine-5'-phosphate decarboxylase [Sneathiella chungangensis]|uniref:Orotidine 5'-phosphate decarboxylase n=1 Tax=Sneathiella chungangensis TaxID=1418234 RepID=A0A845MJ65_9PROT|nr:orotidine-5'-phosphate decarboxylase [Sneathiella chungangensis]MZR24103.1 orotidine-5'-phosphate decarboxylase [Sneathiella chungangensis]
MRLPPQNAVFTAIDTIDLEAAIALGRALAPISGGLKLGKEFFTSHGPQGVLAVAGDRTPLFLDLKFHDIPNTVAGGVRAAAKFLQPSMLTIHASGGPAMIRAAADASAEFGEGRPLILGVTVLTSMDDADLRAVGVNSPAEEQVLRLAELAQANGADGVICSPREIQALRQTCGPDFKLVVPGIRPLGSDHGDQKRVKTPVEAITDGASYLVIGRPITGAPDPAAAASAIVGDIAA